MKEKRPWKSAVLEVRQGQPDPLVHNDDKPEHTYVLFQRILGHFYETASMSRQKTDKTSYFSKFYFHEPNAFDFNKPK